MEEKTNQEEVEQDKGHFIMPVNEVLHISSLGYMMIGYIQSGTVHLGDEVILNNGLKSFVTGINMSDDQGQFATEWATKDEGAGIILGSIGKNALTQFDNLVVEGIDTERNHCEISVSEQSPLKGKGVIVKGKILSGTINVGDPIILSFNIYGQIFRTATADAIEVDGENVQSASQGAMVTINFQGITMRTKCDKIIKR